MSDAGLLPLIVRMVVSLGAVLAVIAVAFVIARHRQSGGASSTRPSMFRARRRSGPPPIEVVGRAGLTKGAVAIALRFGERIVLVGVSEQAPTTVLQEMDAASWDEWNAEDPPADVAPVQPAPDPSGAARGDPIHPPDSVIGPRPSFIDALREATTRRG